MAVSRIARFLDDTFIVISGDAITDMDLTEIANFHHKVNSKATIVTKKVPSWNMGLYWLMKVEE